MRFKSCEIKMMVQMIITTIVVVVTNMPFCNRSILFVTSLLGGQSHKGSLRCRGGVDDLEGLYNLVNWLCNLV